jgi:septal ring factor EnvC (AmiA/AmiB activator)
MAPPENVMMLMKQYLSTMSKRIDDLIAKTQALEAEVGKNAESQRSEMSGLTEKIDRLAATQEDTKASLEKARDELKKRSEDLEANLEGFATLESINELQNKLDKQIETLRDEKLDRSDFQEFENTTFAPLKELFHEGGASPSFAEFASEQAAASPVKAEEELTPPPETVTDEEPSPQLPPPPFEPRRADKKKKKWL